MLPSTHSSTFPPPTSTIIISSSTTSSTTSSTSSPSSSSSSSDRSSSVEMNPTQSSKSSKSSKSRRHVQAAQARKRLAPQRCPHCAHDLALPAVLAQNVQTVSVVARLTVEQRTSVTSAVYANVVGVSPTQARHALNSAAREKLVVRRREQGRDGRYHYRYDPTQTALAYLISSSLARALQHWLADSDALA